MYGDSPMLGPVTTRRIVVVAACLVLLYFGAGGAYLHQLFDRSGVRGTERCVFLPPRGPSSSTGVVPKTSSPVPRSAKR